MKTWIEENQKTYRKQQLKTRITKLRRKDPLQEDELIQAEIKQLEYEYVRLLERGEK